MDHQTYVIAQTKHIFPRLDEIEERLEAEPVSFLPATIEVDEGIRPFSPVISPDTGYDVRTERLRVLEAGRRGLTKIRRAGEARPSLTPEETIGLEAIILMEGRPAIMIRDGRFASPPAEWRILEQHRTSIERIIPSVGRIEVVGHPRLSWVGTGFLVGENVIMTNRHVAVHFAERRRREGWKFIPEIRSRIDFREEFETEASAEYAFAEVLHVHSRVDMALVRVELQSSSDDALPEPMTAHYRSPRGLRDRKVYVIGFPAWDGRRNDPSVMQRIFADIYNVKRLQPGTIRNRLLLGKVFKHDCSTLGGNSGSCVVDLESGKILGLHFAGRYGKHNSAIALWKLRRSVFLRRAGVRFG
jgi:V8-like Glu-specific endopeptidase